MLLTFISFLLWIPAILGIGSLAHIPYRIWVKEKSNETIIENAILGMALISATANWVNFFVAISNIVQVLILLLGWRRFIYILYRKEFKKPSLVLILGAIIVGGGLFFLRATVTPSYYDSGYYGLQNLQWYNTTPLPLGLANLHARFAYNSAWLALASVVQLPTIDFFISGEILLWFMSFIGLFALESGTKGEWSPSVIYGIATSLVILTPVLGAFTISALSTDLSAFWLSIMLGWISLRLLEHKISTSYAIWFTTIAVFLGITLKLSAIPLFLILIGQLFILKKDIRSNYISVLKGIIPLVSFILIPWVGRFFVMSGCFIYPLAFTCVPALEWGVPVDSVAWMVDYIKHFAIDRTLVPADIGLFWFMDKTLFQNWLDLYFDYMETLLLFFFLGAGGIIYLISIKKHQPNRIYQNELVLILSYLGGVIFWFLTAPDIRFGSGYLWGATLLLLSFGVHYLLQQANTRIKNLTSFFLLGSISGLLIISLVRRSNSLLDKSLSPNWIYPASAPIVESYYQRIDGVDIRYPVKSDLLCWGEPLPCTPELNADLKIEKDDTGHITMFYLESSK